MPGEEILRPMAALQQVKPAKPQSPFSLPVFLTADFPAGTPPGSQSPRCTRFPLAHNRQSRLLIFSQEPVFNDFFTFWPRAMVYKISKIYYNNLV